MIDGRIMEEDRIDQTAKLGDTEEWTVINTDQQYHSFHIHQTPFLVTEVGGARGTTTACGTHSRCRRQPIRVRAR